MTQQLDRVRRLVVDLFNVPLEAVNESSSPVTIESWDSLQQLNLALALEQEFGLRLEPEEIQGLTDVRSIVALIESKGAG